MEHGLIWGHLVLKTSLGVTYVDCEQYPEWELLDGRDNVVLPGVSEIMIANGELEFRIKDCNKQVLRAYAVKHSLRRGQNQLVSDEGDM